MARNARGIELAAPEAANASVPAAVAPVRTSASLPISRAARRPAADQRSMAASDHTVPRGARLARATLRHGAMGVDAIPAAAVLAGLVLVAGVVRFATLHVQSYWYDEAVTVLGVLRPSLGATLAQVPHSESTPPLYYLLAWLWSRPFGTGEVALRSLSALFGTATVPAAYLAARALVTRRVGLVIAALVAFSPDLVWYSQEARAYALLVLLTTLALWLAVRAARRPTAGALAWWALVAALALTTHYFALVVIAPQAAWLAWRLRSRLVAAAIALPVLTAGALVPLALRQARTGNSNWIVQYALAKRFEQAARELLAGPHMPASAVLASGLVMVVGAALLALRAARDERAGALLALSLGVAALVLPLLAAVLVKDAIDPRNLLVVWVPLALVPATGLGAERARRIGLMLTLVTCVLGLALIVAVNFVPRLQRADWRGAAATLGRPGAARIVLAPALGRPPLELYLQGARALHGSVAVEEIDLLDWDHPSRGRPPAPLPGFARVAVAHVGTIWISRFRSPVERIVSIRMLRASLACPSCGDGKPRTVLVQD